MKEWKTGQYLLLERNEDYWRGPPAIRQIMFRFLSNSNTRLNQLRSGEVHVVDNVPLDKLPEAEGIDGVQLSRTVANSYLHIALNLREVPAFRELPVRQALAHAVDREAIARDVMFYGAQTALATEPWLAISGSVHFPGGPRRESGG